MTARLDVEGLTWTPLGRRRPVLDGVDLRLDPGERVLLVGPSGGGKSTLLRAVAGVLTSTHAGDLSGRVLVDGEPVEQGGGHAGLLLQDPRDSRVARTVGRDVAFGCENAGLPRERIAQAVAWALDLVGFPFGPDRETAALSGGQAQRLALAGVVAPRPRSPALGQGCRTRRGQTCHRPASARRTWAATWPGRRTTSSHVKRRTVQPPSTSAVCRARSCCSARGVPWTSAPSTSMATHRSG